MYATLFLVYTVAHYENMLVLKTHVKLAQLSFSKGELNLMISHESSSAQTALCLNNNLVNGHCRTRQTNITGLGIIIVLMC